MNQGRYVFLDIDDLLGIDKEAMHLPLQVASSVSFVQWTIDKVLCADNVISEKINLVQNYLPFHLFSNLIEKIDILLNIFKHMQECSKDMYALYVWTFFANILYSENHPHYWEGEILFGSNEANNMWIMKHLNFFKYTWSLNFFFVFYSL